MGIKGFFLFLAAMVHTRPTKKPKKGKKAQREGDIESSSETESVDWDQLEIEQGLSKTPSSTKGKSPEATTARTPPTAAEKGKAPMPSSPVQRKGKSVAKKRGRAGVIRIEEPQVGRAPTQAPNYLVSDERVQDFQFRDCIGERHVNLAALRSRSEAFGRIVDLANLAPICTFTERTGYCAHLVRTFYTNARQLQDVENGPMEFMTTVRGTQLKITPRVIGEVIGLRPSMTGPHYLKARAMTDASWKTVIQRICVADTPTHGITVLSKELLPEYRFLNFIVCYNIQPNMNTKVLRWDRMLLLYLLGHPSEGAELNFNIPYLIWSRMAKYVEHTHVQERLPFPLIIMRILKKFGVSTHSTSYQYSLGTINDSTVVKSLPKQPEESETPSRGHRASASTAPRQETASRQAPAAPSAPTSFSDDDASVTSIYREQQRLSSEQERLSQSQEQICQNIQTLTAANVSLTSKYKSLKKLLLNFMKQMGCAATDDSESDS